jgi:hypothetical protein
MKLNIQLRDAAVAAVVIIIGILLFINIESYEEEIYTGEGPEVDSQPFLALKNHLANYDTKVVVADNYSTLFSNESFNPIFPDASDIIIFTESDVVVSQALSNDILTWVNKGGHIVLGLLSQNYASTYSTNYLLKELGVQTKEFDQELIERDDEENIISGNLPTLVNTQDFGEIEVNVDDRIYIELIKSEEVLFSKGILPDQQPEQATIVQLSFGEGIVTLMTDVYIWNNHQISDNDNLFFIHQLIEYGNTVFVFEQREPIMWHQLIAKYSPSFYWILLFFVSITAWFFAIRFGAIKVVNDTVVSYFSQHIKAAGQFYWMNEQQDKLLAGARYQLIDHISLRLSKTSPTQEQIIEALAKISNWPKEKIYLFVYSNNKVNETQFTQIMQGLQQLRKMI